MREKRRIRCVDIATELGVTRPSVSKMMKCMVRMELVEPEYQESVRLTQKGLEIAEQGSSDFDAVYSFFRRILRLPPAQAKEHAFLFLSDFPQHTVQKLSSLTERSLESARRRRQIQEKD